VKKKSKVSKLQWPEVILGIMLGWLLGYIHASCINTVKETAIYDQQTPADHIKAQPTFQAVKIATPVPCPDCVYCGLDGSVDLAVQLVYEPDNSENSWEAYDMFKIKAKSFSDDYLGTAWGAKYYWLKAAEFAPTYTLRAWALYHAWHLDAEYFGADSPNCLVELKYFNLAYNKINNHSEALVSKFMYMNAPETE